MVLMDILVRVMLKLDLALRHGLSPPGIETSIARAGGVAGVLKCDPLEVYVLKLE
jgi:hypothetical protein